MLAGRAPIAVSCGLCMLLAAIVSPAAAQEPLNSLIAVEKGAVPFQDLIDLNADPFGFAEGKHHLRVSQATIDELRTRGVEVEVLYAVRAPQAPATITLRVDGVEVGSGRIERSVQAGFTASETFDVGMDLGSPVALDYLSRVPFAFDGTIRRAHIKYI